MFLPHKTHLRVVPRLLSLHTLNFVKVSGVYRLVRDKCANKVSKCYILIIYLVLPMFIKIRKKSVCVLITCAKFYYNRFRDFNSVGCKILPRGVAGDSAAL